MRTTSSALLPVYHVRGLRVFSTILPKQLRLAQQADKQKSAIALFPELGLSAYAIEDLLFQDALLDAVERAIDQLVEESRQLFSVPCCRGTAAAPGRLSFRTRTVGGPVNPNPQHYQGDGTASASGWTLIAPAQIASLIATKSLLFAVHGFNVSQSAGANSLGLLDKYLKLSSPNVFIGVLWPGDSVIPIVDYPFEGNVAIDCGARLAAFCNESCSSAQSISFMSHSLGARLVLQAVVQLDRKAQSVCLTAAAR